MWNEDRFQIGIHNPKRRLNILPDSPEEEIGTRGRFPSWLHRKLPVGNQLAHTGKILKKNRLHTVCEEAKCPNLLECWSKKTATFLVLGKQCTRSCGFCDIEHHASPQPPDPEEPHRIVEAIADLDLRHVVITMVARDDLEDGGAAHLCQIVQKIREELEGITIELLTSDFAGNSSSWLQMAHLQPNVFNHNIETVERLTPRVRHKATYSRSLELLQFMDHKRKKLNLPMRIKSGLMVGLGEHPEEVESSLRDLKQVGCDIVTIGQYLQPNLRKLLVKEFIHPDQFQAYAAYGKSIGIDEMFCAPFVRSSYHAGEIYQHNT